MDSVTGIFRSREAAREAASELRQAGFGERVNLLLPGASEDDIHSVTTSETEQPGMGKAVGGVLGAALGAAGGFELGAGITALIPGVGPVLAVGLAGAAMLGVGGAMGGAAAGAAAERASTEGLPADEIFFYEDALRQGRSLVIAMPEDEAQAARARETMKRHGAEGLDAAREEWWIGLRDAEASHYRKSGGDFECDQSAYRAGFEAALRRETRGKTMAEVDAYLKAHCPGVCDCDGFRRGYERGQTYLERLGAIQ